MSMPLVAVLVCLLCFVLVLVITGSNSIQESRREKFKQAVRRGDISEARRILKKLYSPSARQELEKILEEAGYSHISLEELLGKSIQR